MESRARNGVRFMIETSEMVRLGGVTGSGEWIGAFGGEGDVSDEATSGNPETQQWKMGGMK